MRGVEDTRIYSLSTPIGLIQKNTKKLQTYLVGDQRYISSLLIDLASLKRILAGFGSEPIGMCISDVITRDYVGLEQITLFHILSQICAILRGKKSRCVQFKIKSRLYLKALVTSFNYRGSQGTLQVPYWPPTRIIQGYFTCLGIYNSLPTQDRSLRIRFILIQLVAYPLFLPFPITALVYKETRQSLYPTQR